MSNSLCKSSVFKTYQDVISDVIQNVREHFLEDGIDETVLQELKSLWETKLTSTKAVEEVKEGDKLMDALEISIKTVQKIAAKGIQRDSDYKIKVHAAHVSALGTPLYKVHEHTIRSRVYAMYSAAANNKAQKLQQQQQQNYLNQITQQQNQAKQLVGQVPPNNHIPQGIAFPEWRRVPVQLTIPSPPGCGSGEQRVLGIEVPEVFLQGPYLKSILTGPIISATLNLPLDAATTFLQDQVNNAFLKHQQSTNFLNINMGINQSILQADGCSIADEETVLYTKSLTNQIRAISGSRKSGCRYFGVSSYLQYNCSCLNVNFKRREAKKVCRCKEKKKRASQSCVQPLFESNQKNTDTEQKQSEFKTLLRENCGDLRELSNKFKITVKLTKNNKSAILTPSSAITTHIYQGDGMHSSSDDDDLDDDDEDNDNEDDNDLNDDIEEETQEAAEDEPLNSEDDVSDADGTEESFETDNVIVCQFDKITRARNRWKFHLKDGIMSLNGEDYVFQKANGDAEW